MQENVRLHSSTCQLNITEDWIEGITDEMFPSAWQSAVWNYCICVTEHLQISMALWWKSYVKNRCDASGRILPCINYHLIIIIILRIIYELSRNPHFPISIFHPVNFPVFKLYRAWRSLSGLFEYKSTTLKPKQTTLQQKGHG